MHSCYLIILASRVVSVGVGQGEMTDDHHQRINAGKGVRHRVGSGRNQKEGEGHSIEMERDLGRQ